MSQTTDKPTEARKVSPVQMLLELGEKMECARNASRDSEAMTADIIESYRNGFKNLLADLNDANMRIAALEKSLHDMRPKDTEEPFDLDSQGKLSICNDGLSKEQLPPILGEFHTQIEEIDVESTPKTDA